MDVPAPHWVNISNTYGCMLAGCLLSCMVWGISCLQTFLYFAHYEYDSWHKKLLVAFLWVLDTVNEILILKSLWPTLILRWGDQDQLNVLIKELIHHAWIAQILEFCVQLYFIHRIYVFSGKKRLFPAIMIILSVFQLIILIPYDIITLRGGAKEKNLSTTISVSMVIALRSVTAAEDVILSATLLYLIYRRRIPEFDQTRRLVVRLLVVTANTGLWTAVVAFVELSLVAAFPTGLQFTVVEFPLCSLYFSSLLASLNAREYVRGSREINTDSEARAPPSSGSNGSTLNLEVLGRSNRIRFNGSNTPPDDPLAKSESMDISKTVF